MTVLPEMNAVKSSNIESAGHDGQHAFIKFKDGDVYQYSDVPASVFTDMMQADSVGSFFHKNIKGKYTSKKWSESDIDIPVDEEEAAPMHQTVRDDNGNAHPMEQEAQDKAKQQA